MKGFSIALVIVCLGYIAGVSASLVTDHLDNVARKEAHAAYDLKMHNLSVKMCAEGKGGAFIYDGKRCKQN
jgi:hypothetical protein